MPHRAAAPHPAPRLVTAEAPASAPVPGPDAGQSAILDAAERVALRDGVGRVTLDAVAREAGLSKSGLIHHYASKDLLLTALVQRKVADWWLACSAAMAQQQGRGAATRGLIQACFQCADEAAEQTDPLRRGCVVLAALVHDRAHVEPVRQTQRAIEHRLASDGLDQSVTDLIRMALDGLWFNMVLGLGELSPRRLEALRARMGTLASAEQARGASRPRSADTGLAGTIKNRGKSKAKATGRNKTKTPRRRGGSGASKGAGA